MKKYALIILSLFVTLWSCKQEERLPVAVETVELNHLELTLKVGESYVLIATVYPDNAENQDVSWCSSDETIAVVSGGEVTALSVGEAIITVMTDDGGYTADCFVTVVEEDSDEDVVKVERVTLNKESIIMTIGDEQTLTATVYPSNATNKNLTWTSSATSVVSVNNGKVKAVSSGSAQITVTTEDGGRTAICAVTVTQTAGPSWGLCGTFNDWGQNGNKDIVMSDSTYENYYVTTNVSLSSNSEFKFRYNNSWDDNYGLSTSMSSISVNSMYSLTKAGSNIVMAAGGIYDIFLSKSFKHCYVMTKGSEPQDAVKSGEQAGPSWGLCGTFNDWGQNGDKDIIMTQSSYENYYVVTSIQFTSNDEFKFRYNNDWGKNYGGEDKYSTFSANTEYPTVANGKNIKVAKNGTFDIYLSKSYDKFYIMDENQAPGDNGSMEVRVESVKLNESSLSMYVGDEYQLIAEIIPSNATNKNVKWSSNNTGNVSVEDGKLHALNIGSATITVTTEDGGKIATCTVIVSPQPEDKPDTDFDLSASGSMDGYDYVDLGLSVLWATHNIGTDKIEGIGEYYAWGELTPYNKKLTYINYGWNYPPCSPDAVLSSIYDTATELWGRSWRMPTADEQKELINGCDWTWIDNINSTSVSGYVATSKKNGKSIFLPATKFISGTSSYTPKDNDAIYWSASAYSVAGSLSFGSGGDCAQCLQFVTISGMKAPVEMNMWQMGSGATIRPVIGSPNDYYPDPRDLTHDEAETQRQGYSVSGKNDGYTYVDLGFPSRTLWATYNVGAELPVEYGDYFAWGETSPKDLYVAETYIFFDGYKEGVESHSQFSKYVMHKENGKPDGKDKLEYSDDAAYVNWGENWCMPTQEQVEELGNLCEFWRKDVYVNGKQVIGYIGESKLNGNRIYIPAAGWEYSDTPNAHMSLWYWTAELSAKVDYYAKFMVHNEELGGMTYWDGTSRWQGLPVRAVVKK